LEHSKVYLALSKALRKVKLQLMLEPKKKEWMNNTRCPYFITRGSAAEHFRVLEIDTNYMLNKRRKRENYSFDPTNEANKNYSFDNIFKFDSTVILSSPA
jgi:hypothetical protein